MTIIIIQMTISKCINTSAMPDTRLFSYFLQFKCPQRPLKKPTLVSVARLKILLLFFSSSKQFFMMIQDDMAGCMCVYVCGGRMRGGDHLYRTPERERGKKRERKREQSTHSWKYHLVVCQLKLSEVKSGKAGHFIFLPLPCSCGNSIKGLVFPLTYMEPVCRRVRSIGRTYSKGEKITVNITCVERLRGQGTKGVCSLSCSVNEVMKETVSLNAGLATFPVWLCYIQPDGNTITTHNKLSQNTT